MILVGFKAELLSVKKDMLIDQFDFKLPEHLIAQGPVSPRDYAKMLVFSRADNRLDWAHFYDLPNYLGPNDVLVFNNSRVIPARLLFKLGDKEAELLFLEEVNGLWKTMVRPGRNFQVGRKVVVYGVELEVKSIDQDGQRYLKASLDGAGMRDFLLKYGQMPVPPYIGRNQYKQEDYNTIYSSKSGSVAAPTAGLHFTEQLLSRLLSKGVKLEFVTLHVGLGTFLPVKVKDTRQHRMHEERYEIDWQTAKRLNQYVAEGKRIIAVGTTTVRVLEDNFSRFNQINPGSFSTNILIEPGYSWKIVSALITNFHLPKSTLLLLVSALIGREKTLELYQKAIARGFRFYSFGDGMLII